MKYIARQQIKDLFYNPIEAMGNGLWFSGYIGEGVYKRWHENGNMWQYVVYENSRINGEYKRWYSNGKFAEHTVYKNDKQIEEYDSAGKKIDRGNS